MLNVRKFLVLAAGADLVAGVLFLAGRHGGLW